MTAQIPDLFLYREEEFHLAGISEPDLFHPKDLGLQPVGSSTASMSGYQVVFALADEQLVLHRLEVELLDGNPWRGEPCTRIQGPEIRGVKPTRGGKNAMFNNIYRDLDLPLRYTGGLIIAADFIRDLYVHMGFHPFWKYRRVRELVFENGVLQQDDDMSQPTAELRQKLLDEVHDPRDAGRRPGEGLIEPMVRSFSRRYWRE